LNEYGALTKNWCVVSILAREFGMRGEYATFYPGYLLPSINDPAIRFMIRDEYFAL
jgi:hypothetical protein